VNSYAVGVDIGGTKIDSVLMDSAGNVIRDVIVPTAPQEGAAAVFDRIAASVAQLADNAPGAIVSIGIGCTGLVNQQTGIVENSVHLGWQKTPLRDGVRERLRFDVPIAVENDLKAAALGEKRFGAGQDSAAFVYLAIGTGLGSAAVIGDRVVSGSRGLAMELGHLVIDPQGRRCACGRRGCLETLLSGTGLAHAAGILRHDHPESTLYAGDDKPTTAAVLAAARAGDPFGRLLIDEMRGGLARALSICAAIYNPDLIVLGGGFGLAAWDLLTDGVTALARELALPELFDGLRLSKPECPRQAIGAGAVGLQAIGQ